MAVVVTRLTVAARSLVLALLTVACGAEQGPQPQLSPPNPLITTIPVRLQLPAPQVEEALLGSVVQSGLQVSPPVAFVARWSSTDTIEINWQEPLRPGVRYELQVAPSLGGPQVLGVWTELLRLLDARSSGTEVVLDFNLAVDPAALTDRLVIIQAGEALAWRSKQSSPSRRIRLSLATTPSEEFELRLDGSLLPAAGGTPLNKSVTREVRTPEEVTLLSAQSRLHSGRRLISLCFDAELSASDLKAQLAAPLRAEVRERDGRIELLGNFADPVTVTIKAGLKSKDGRLLETELETTVAAPAWPALGFADGSPQLNPQGRLELHSAGLGKFQVSASSIPPSSLPGLLAGASVRSLAAEHRSWDVDVASGGVSSVVLPKATTGSLWFVELSSVQAPWLRAEGTIVQGGLSVALHRRPEAWTALVEDTAGAPVGQATLTWIRRSGKTTKSRTLSNGRSDLATSSDLRDPLVWVTASLGPRFVHLPLRSSLVEEVSDRSVDSAASLLVDRVGVAPSELMQGVLLSGSSAKIWVRAGAYEAMLADASLGVPFSVQLPSDLPPGPASIEARSGARLIARVPVSVAPAGPVPFRLKIEAQQDGAFAVSLAPGDFHSVPESVQLTTSCSFEALSSRFHGRLPESLSLGQQTLGADARVVVSCPLPPAGTQVRLHASAPEAGGATMVSSVASDFGAPQLALVPSADGLRIQSESKLTGAQLRFTFANGESEQLPLDAAEKLVPVAGSASSQWARVEVIDPVRGMVATRTVISSTASQKLLSWASDLSAAPGGRWQSWLELGNGLDVRRGAGPVQKAAVVGHRVGPYRVWYRRDQTSEQAKDVLQLTPPPDLNATVLNFNYATPAGRRTRVWVFAVDPARQSQPVDPRVPAQWAVYDSAGPQRAWTAGVDDSQLTPSLHRVSQWPSSQNSVVKGPLRPSGAGYGPFALVRSRLPRRCRVDVVAEVDGRYEVHSQMLPEQGAGDSWPPWLRQGDKLKLGSEQSAPPGLIVEGAHAVAAVVEEAPGGPRLKARPQLALGGSTQFASHRQSAHFEAKTSGVLRVGPRIIDGFRAALAQAKTRSDSAVAAAARLLVETAFGEVDQELRSQVAATGARAQDAPSWQVILTGWALQSTGRLSDEVRTQLRTLLNDPTPSLCSSARYLLAVDGQRTSPCPTVPAISIAESAAADILRGDRQAGFAALQRLEAPSSPAELGLSLLALLRVAPRHEMVTVWRDQLVASAQQGSWGTPEADAFAALALFRCQAVAPAIKPYWGSILSGGRVLKRFSNQRTTEIELSAEQLSQGVDVTVTGAGRVQLGLATVSAPGQRQDRLRIERTVSQTGPVRRGDVIDVSIKLERPAGSGGKSLIQVEEYLPAGISTEGGRASGTLSFEAKLAPGEQREFRYKARALWSGRFEWPGVWAEAPWERPVLAARSEDAHLTVD